MMAWSSVANVGLARQRIGPDSVPWALNLPPMLLRSSAKRQNEFLAGRACARHALRQAGYAGPDPALLPLPDGAPTWPAGWLGSISHTDAQAVAVAASTASCRALGIDRETQLEPATAREVRPVVAMAGELDPLLAVTDPVSAVAILFSAKEALFKALAASLGGFADFDAARLVRCIPGGIELRLRVNWGGEWPAGTVLPIKVAQEASGAVETLVYVRC